MDMPFYVFSLFSYLWKMERFWLKALVRSKSTLMSVIMQLDCQECSMDKFSLLNVSTFFTMSVPCCDVCPVWRRLSRVVMSVPCGDVCPVW